MQTEQPDMHARGPLRKRGVNAGRRKMDLGIWTDDQEQSAAEVSVPCR